MDGYTVGEVARLARISVRTLHHYDGIGLLTPSARSVGGYRLYSEIDDWIAIKAEADASINGFAEAIRSGEPAAGQVAMDLAEAHRQHISRWFYDCDHQMHRGLADIYVSDPRFTAAYDGIEPGFSQYVHDAMYANAARGQARS
jgi:DNA-binding transcriptional MerR regulator